MFVELFVSEGVDGVLFGGFQGWDGAGEEGDKHNHKDDGDSNAGIKFGERESRKVSENLAGFMENGICCSAKKVGNSDAKKGAPESEKDSFKRKFEENAGFTHAEGFFETDFTSAFFDGHEKSVDDADGGGDEGNGAKDIENEENDI